MKELDKEPYLFNGKTGDLLFKSYANRNIKNQTIQDILNLFDGSWSFSSGCLGTFWVLAHLKNKKILQVNQSIFESFDALTEQYIIKNSFKHYDFMHSDLGVVPYLIESKNKRLLKEVFRKLIPHKIKYNNYFAFEERSSDETFIATKINLGLSHGNASILALCNILFSENLLPNLVLPSLNNYLNLYVHLLSHKNTFPNFIIDGKPTIYHKSLAWCYGDLGVLYQLLWASQLTNNQTMISLFTNLLLKLAQQRNGNSNLMEIGFCHGTAGISYIFHKVFLITGEPLFQDAAKYWNNITKDIIESEDQHQHDLSLLNGLTGVKMVQHTIQGKIDSDWDRCFLLS